MSRENTMNARFWDRINGDWVKITLKPGESIEHHTYEKHDEGYEVTHDIYSFDGFVLNHQYGRSGRDCDGKYSSTNEREARLLDMCSIPAVDANGEQVPGVFRCDWKDTSEESRDYTAEAMGY